MRTPSADLDTRYSEPEAEASTWDEAAAILAAAEPVSYTHLTLPTNSRV